MAIWMEYEQFRKQIEQGADIEARAPCPSDFDTAKSATSHWIGEQPIDFEAQWTDAPLPSEAEIVIIGSGITGAAVAHHLSLQKPHLKVAVLEARGICTGATGRNGGHLSRPETYDMRFLAEKFGVEEAIRLRRLPILTRDMILDTVYELGIADEIDLQVGGTWTIFGSEAEKEDIEKDMNFAKASGMPVESVILNSDQMKEKINVSDKAAEYGGAFLERSGSFSPRKFVAALLRRALRTMPQLSLHPYTPVTAVRKAELGTGYIVETRRGSIKSRVVIHATNAWASHLLPTLQGTKGVFGVKCHVLAVHPTADRGEQMRYGFGYDRMWHWAIQRPNHGPLIYGWSGLEQIADYNDSITVDDDMAREKMFKFLNDNFKANFPIKPTKKDVSYDWTGIQGFTANGASLVGRPIKENLGEFMSVGHNGEGMGRCWSCSLVLTDKIIHYLDGGHEAEWSAPKWFPQTFLYNI